MPKPSKLRLVIILTILMLVGCQTMPEPQTLPEPDDMVSGRIVISSRPESSMPELSSSEKPSVNEKDLFEASSSSEAPPAPSSSEAPPAPSSSEAPPAPSSSEVPPVPSSSEAPPAPSSSEAPPAPSSSEAPSAASSSGAPPRQQTSVSASNEVRAIWITYLELAPIMQGRSQSQFTASIAEMFDNCANYGINTIFAHVRPFGDALYQSDYFPWSYIATGVEGQNPGYDPLEIMLREAHSRGMKLEAWINPYRVRHDKKYPLSAGNQAKIWLDEGSANVATNGTYIVYNPASKQTRDLIVNGVREIVRNYNVDGIHIDDYFYPATLTEWDKTFDTSSYNAYKSAGGNLSHADWRRANVATLIKAIYSAVKSENPRVLFGISPQSSVYNNYNAMYFDVQSALANTGYCDYICPQIYFGFENGTQPYHETLVQWDNMIRVPGVKLYPGLAVYKAGAADSWAGAGKAEWQQNNNIIARQVEDARACGNYGGFALYRYDSLFKPDSSVKSHIAREAANLEDIL